MVYRGIHIYSLIMYFSEIGPRRLLEPCQFGNRFALHEDIFPLFPEKVCLQSNFFKKTYLHSYMEAVSHVKSGIPKSPSISPSR